jgi:hypothetical protein
MNIMLSILTFENYYDVIPIIASSFVTISLWINNPDLTKKISAPVSLSFLIYDIFVHSHTGIINESLSIISTVSMGFDSSVSFFKSSHSLRSLIFLESSVFICHLAKPYITSLA